MSDHAFKRRDFSYHGLLVGCNLCASMASDSIARKDRDGYKTEKSLCRDCGMIYTNPMPTTSELRTFYRPRYDRIRKEDKRQRMKRIYRGASRALTRYNRVKIYLKPGATVLDASACYGEMLYLLNKHGYDASGIESNPALAEFGRNTLGLNIKNQFFDELELPSNHFDVVISHHLLNLCLDPKKMLNKYHAALNEGGILNLEVPNIETKYKSPLHRLRFKHFYNFNLFTIQMLVQQSGFDILNTILIPNTHHINIIARKRDITPKVAKSKDNYHRVRQAIMGYKSLGYMVSTAPYLKMYHNIRKHFRLLKLTRDFSDAIELLEHVYKDSQ
jgi:SAM-dependent methyltransferase